MEGSWGDGNGRWKVEMEWNGKSGIIMRRQAPPDNWKGDGKWKKFCVEDACPPRSGVNAGPEKATGWLRGRGMWNLEIRKRE